MSEHSLALPGGRTISYRLKISARRRSIGLRVDQNGLTVHTPPRVARAMLEGVLRDKAGWILGKLEAWQQRPQAEEIADGSHLRHLGRDILLCLRTDSRQRAAEFDGARLHVSVKDPQDVAAVRKRLAQWFAGQAREDFERRIALLSAKLGVDIPPLFLSNARTRWGSCNSRGEIRLHWRLIQAPPHIIQYVVAHELAHLKEMNHSERFWQWVEKLYPDYKAARQELKALSAQLHLL